MNHIIEPVLDENGIKLALQRMAMGIAARNHSGEPLGIVGLISHGNILARRLTDMIKELGVSAVCGSIDISLYRDDIYKLESHPALRSSDLPFSTDDMRIVLVDDVLNTGRTIRAALNALFDYGRPARVELACLIDRNCREVPIQPDYVGHLMDNTRSEVVVKLQESDGLDIVTLRSKA